MPRLADGEHRVEMDVGLDQRRGHERPAQIDDLAGLRLRLGDAAFQDPDLPGVRLPRDPGPLQEKIEHRREASRDLNSAQHRRYVS